jgi:DEAD/DEAH box helicase domain-containing protein
MEELYQLVQLSGRNIKTFTYDGDTPQDARRAIRGQARWLPIRTCCTPHPPHHTKMGATLQEPKCVVIDELHTYLVVLEAI